MPHYGEKIMKKDWKPKEKEEQKEKKVELGSGAIQVGEGAKIEGSVTGGQTQKQELHLHIHGQDVRLKEREDGSFDIKMGRKMEEELIESTPKALRDFREENEKEGVEKKGLDLKKFFRYLVKNISEDKFPGVKKLEKEDPKLFEKMSEEFIDAILEKDPEERNKKLDELFEKYEIAAKAKEEIKKIGDEIANVKQKAGDKKLTPEEAKKEEEKLSTFKGKLSKLWEKVGVPFGSFLFYAFLILVMLELIAVQYLVKKSSQIKV